MPNWFSSTRGKPMQAARRKSGAKIPALALDNGTNLIESACIADDLVHRSGNDRLSPLNGAQPDLRMELLGLGRAVMDCAFGSVIQERFSPGSPLIVRWLAACRELPTGSMRSTRRRTAVTNAISPT